MESCSKPPKMWFKHYEHRVTDRGRKGKVKNADFQDRSSSNSSSSRHLHFTELLETFHGRWSRATLWETLYGGHGGLGHVPIWLGSGTFHGSKFPWCCYTVGVRSFIHPSFFLPVNHLRGGKKKKDSEFCLLSLWLFSLGSPGSAHPLHPTPFTGSHTYEISIQWETDSTSSPALCHQDSMTVVGAAWTLVLGLRLRFYLFLAARPLGSHWLSLSFGFFICKMGIIIATLGAIMKIKWKILEKAFSMAGA